MGVLARVRRFCNSVRSVDKDPATELGCSEERPSRPCEDAAADGEACEAAASVRSAFSVPALAGSAVALAVTSRLAVLVWGEKCTPLISRKCLSQQAPESDERMSRAWGD